LIEDVKSFKMGSPDDMGNFITAVIHEASFDKLANYIDQAKKDADAEIIVGGNYDKSKGYFINPTVIERPMQNMKPCAQNFLDRLLRFIFMKTRHFQKL